MKKLPTRFIPITLLFVVAAIALCAVAMIIFVRNAKEIDVVAKVIDDQTGKPVAGAKVILTAEHISELDTNTRPRGFGTITNDQGMARFRCTAPFMVSRRRMSCEAVAPGKYGNSRVEDDRCVIRTQELSGGVSKPYLEYETFTGSFGYVLTFEEGRVSGPSPSGSAR